MWLEKAWYAPHLHPLCAALLPLSGLYCAIVTARRWAYQKKYFTSHKVNAPIIIVGNLTVGGTGKTPLVITLTNFFKQEGFTVGVISRGYGGRAGKYPYFVHPHSDPHVVGDEPLIIARRTACPVAIAPQRVQAAQFLITHHHCNLIISDDGLQHYALQRDIEIAVLDGARRYGNGYCLPAGALREPRKRLQAVDFIVTRNHAEENEIPMYYQGNTLHSLKNPEQIQSLNALQGQTVHALAGIGNPEQFFTTLRENGLNIHPHIFPDHYRYTAKNIYFADNLPVILTEKDAVKCQNFAGKQHWYLPIEAILPIEFKNKLLEKVHIGLSKFTR